MSYRKKGGDGHHVWHCCGLQVPNKNMCFQRKKTKTGHEDKSVFVSILFSVLLPFLTDNIPTRHVIYQIITVYRKEPLNAWSKFSGTIIIVNITYVIVKFYNFTLSSLFATFLRLCLKMFLWIIKATKSFKLNRIYQYTNCFGQET